MSHDKLENPETTSENEEYDALTALYCMANSNVEVFRSGGGPSFPSFEEVSNLHKQQPKLSYSSLSLKDMEEIMDAYGPECIIPKKKPVPAKAESTRRKFIRWNPNFFYRFRYDTNLRKFTPIYGETAERIWRQAVRMQCKKKAAKKKKKKINCGSYP